MIIKTVFRTPGGLGPYLLRVEAGHSARLLVEHCAGVTDLATGLRHMVALTRRRPGITRPIVHTMISPDHPLSDAELVRVLELYEQVYLLRRDLRIAVGHEKGVRPEHVHLGYSRIGQNGLAVQSDGSYEKDERISRQLEIEFGEKITPGPHLAENIANFRHSGRDDLADLLEPYLSEAVRSGLSRADRSQAARLEVDAAQLSRAVYDAFVEAQRDLTRFVRLADGAGFSIAAGSSARLIVHDASGWSTPIARCLRREGKSRGDLVTIKEADVVAASPCVGDFDTVRDQGLDRSTAGAREAVLTQERTARIEAAAQGNTEFMRALDAFRAKFAETEREEQHEAASKAKTLKARREAIIALERRRDDLRRMRVDAAASAARLLDRPGLRQALFVATASTVLLSGAGLTVALVAGGMAVAAVPTMARARKAKAAALRDRVSGRLARDRELSAMNEAQGSRTQAEPGPARFSFNDVSRQDRILAGLYAIERLSSGAAGVSLNETARRAAESLGPEVVRRIDRMLTRGSAAQVLHLRRWYTGVQSMARDVSVAAALARHDGPQQVSVRSSQGNNDVQPRPRRQKLVKRDSHGR